MESSGTRSVLIAEIGPCPLLGQTTLGATDVASCAKELSKDGLRKSLLVRPSSGKEGPKYELIWGEGCLAAARQLGWSSIESRVETLSDQQALIARLREAAATDELTAVDRAKEYHRLHQPPFTLSFAQIAAELGLKDATSVRRFDRLLLQPQDILDLLSKRVLREGHLRYLAQVTNLRQRVALAKRAAKGAWSIDRLRRQVTRLRPHRPAGSRRGSGQGYDYNGFHLSRDGDRILFSGRDFCFSRESPASYASALQTALESFIKNHMTEETAAALRAIEQQLGRQ